MFSDSVHPKNFFEAIYFAVTGFSYLIILAILIVSLAIVTFAK